MESSSSSSSSSSLRMLPAILLLLFLLMASEMGTTKVEARHCESQSHKFVGLCVREDNCKNVCQGEGFHAGLCRGHAFNRKCYCTKPC